MGAGDEKRTIYRFGCPCADDCGGCLLSSDLMTALIAVSKFSFFSPRCLPEAPGPQGKANIQRATMAPGAARVCVVLSALHRCPWVSTAIQNGNHDDALMVFYTEDPEWEALHKCTANGVVNCAVCGGMLGNRR